MQNQHHQPDPSVPSGRRGRSPRRTRCLAATVIAAVAIGGFVDGAAEAGMTGPAIVECNAAYNTVKVTPRVLSDHANSQQWTATRVWIATWNGTTRTWQWSAQQWKVELANQQNSPIATDISRLTTQELNLGDGYYYVYVEAYMWNGSSWYGGTGDFTRTYTQVTPSVSHEPETRTQASYCSL